MDYQPSAAALLVDYYEQYLIDQDMGAFLRQTSDRYFVGTLERLAAAGERAARRAAVLALGRLADYRSNAILGKALTDADRGVRTLAENAIGKVWLRLGTAAQQRRLTAIAEQIDEQDFERAAVLAGKLVQEAPWIAHAWFQRGVAYFNLAQYDASQRDCHQALEINAYHFRAAAIMGQAHQLSGNLVSALECYRRALRINPQLEDIRARLIQLQRTLKEKP
ncbi:MAG: tetratricopeptide repeat protein [Planctomycetales bacterium]|nr:tetratricopeptide repeat protein [Planctomycetales bacterium]